MCQPNSRGTSRNASVPSRHLSLLSAWAFAFGCAVGWDSFVMPWTEFLPMAGPVGTMTGILAGAVIMGIVAWNYHYMINRQPGEGGVYAYASATFGGDHGFLCAWFLCFTYMAIVWMDATVLGVVAHWAFGDLFQFGFHYTVAGLNVHLGYVLLSVGAIALTTVLCCRRSFARIAQTAMALVFATGLLACFAAAAIRHGGGLDTLAPAFSPFDGSPHISQVAHIMALAPWLFVGFESISNLSGEFRFPLKKSFGVMAAALGTSVLAYVLLAALPPLVSGVVHPNWVAAIATIGEQPDFVAWGEAARVFGGVGTGVLVLILVASIFTNLVGNTVAASRLIAAMADDRVLPSWFGGRSRDGSPRHAVIAIACLSVAITALGRKVIGLVVDMALVGAAVGYAYTSAATCRVAHASGNRVSRATGFAGVVLSVGLVLLFILPNVTTHTTLMSTQSYLIVVLWCTAGLVAFLSVFLRDRSRRFGQSTVVWISLLAVILFMSIMWIRESTYETTRKAFDDIIEYHSSICLVDLPNGEHGEEAHFTRHGGDWRENLKDKLDSVNETILRNNVVQVGLTVLAFALMLVLYSVLRRREHEHDLEKARAKSYFFSTVSHDIRTPLNAIIGFSEMLKAGFPTEEEREQALESILVSSKTLLGLINDVLDLSKLESGKMEIVPEPTDCPRLFRELMEAFRVSGGKSGLELRCRTGEMPALMLDPQRLRQIVFNLVGNAVKFTEEGHVELRAGYERTEGGEDGVFRFEVEDTGCGIGEEDLKRIGAAYVQLRTKVSRNGGTGLGLAICNQLVAAMGGTMKVVSELGRGSTFSVTLPGVKPAPSVSESEPEASSAESKAGPRFPDVRRILLVDDSKMNLMVLKAHLKRRGHFDIALASDGQEALETLEAPGSAPFDLVLTDMWMPNLDGEGLLRAIRANPRFAGLRVVIVTADVELQAKAAELGVDAILFKPVTSEKLRQLLGDGNPAEAGGRQPAG